MDNGNLYKTVRVAESHDYERVEVDYETTFQEQPEELRHPCRICLQYYAIDCMKCCPPYEPTGHIYSQGVCKICKSEYMEEYRASPEFKARRNKLRRMRYKEDPVHREKELKRGRDWKKKRRGIAPHNP